MRFSMKVPVQTRWLLFSVVAVLSLGVLPNVLKAQGFIPKPESTDPKALEKAIADNRLKVWEFQFLRQAAVERGARIWISGGLAYAFGAYERAIAMNRLGKIPSYSIDQFTSWAQDFDVIVDGTDEDIEYIKQRTMQFLGRHQGAKSTWEFRSLTSDYDGKDALVGAGSEFLKRHSDSASLGMIELTDPAKGESVVRDLEHWKTKKGAEFLEDMANGVVRLYLRGTHEQTILGRTNSPPLTEALRIIIKAAQFDLALSEKDILAIRSIVQNANMRAVMSNEYTRRWLIRNGVKIFWSSRNFEYANWLLDQTDMRAVLRGLQHPADANHWYHEAARQLADLMGTPILHAMKPGSGNGSTAKDLGLSTILYEGTDYRVWEVLENSPSHRVNLFTTEETFQGVKHQVAVFKAPTSASKSVENGFAAVFEIAPDAREGADFFVSNRNGNVYVTNASVLKKSAGSIPFRMTPLAFVDFLEDLRNQRAKQARPLDFKAVERLASHVDWSKNDAKSTAAFAKLVESEIKKQKPELVMLTQWFNRPESANYPQIVKDAVATGNLELYSVLMMSLFNSKVWAADPVAHQALEDVLDEITDPANRMEKRRQTFLKDFYKSRVLKTYPNYVAATKRLLNTPEDVAVFMDRYIGRIVPSEDTAYAELLKYAMSKGGAQAGVLYQIAKNENHRMGGKIAPVDFEAFVAQVNPKVSPLQIVPTSASTTANSGSTATSSASASGTPTTSSNSNSVYTEEEAQKNRKLFELNPPPEKEDLANLILEEMSKAGAAKLAEIFLATNDIENDKISSDLRDKELMPVYGRREEALTVMDTLVRMKGKNPVLLGEAGVGKTAVMKLVAQMIYFGDLPVAREHQRVLKNAIVVETSPARISKLAKSDAPVSQAAAIEDYIAAIRAVQKAMGVKVIVYMDEMHELAPAQIEALKASFDSKDGILFVGGSTHSELLMLINNNKAFARRIRKVDIPEFNEAQTKELLLQAVVPALERKYAGEDGTNATITSDAVDMAIRRAVEYAPEQHRPEAPYKLLMDALVWMHRKTGRNAPTLDDNALGAFLVHTLRLPLDPTHLSTFEDGLKKLRGSLLDRVVEQDRFVDAMIESWRRIYFANEPKDRVKIMIVTGPTGSGKTHGAREFAKQALGSVERFLEIDANAYSSGGLSLNSLLGAPNGVISSDTTKGVLPEFFSGRGKGMSVIVINEFEKAHPDLARALMEFFDTGKLQGGDGQTYYAGRCLVILTTNKGDDRIYPRDQDGALSRKEIEQRLSRITDDMVKQWFMEPNTSDLYDKSKELPPAFMQRIKYAVPVAPVSFEGAIEIAQKKVNSKAQGLFDAYKIKLEVAPEVVERLVRAKYVPENGVRAVEDAVEALIDTAILDAGKIAVKGDTIQIGLKIVGVGKDEFPIALKKTGSDGSVVDASVAPAPRERGQLDNPLHDDHTRNLVSTLGAELGKYVFGQDHAVELTERAIRPHFMSSKRDRPISLLYLGQTGTGKTELAKAIARVAFGNDKRMEKFDMGTVQWEGDFNNIFSPPKGFVGSDTMPAFERFLVNFPEGGVLLFDEIGNMGGGKLKVKHSLLMKFYSLLDEGKWKSPHGKVYDLSKYVFVFTSNEGQEHMQGSPSDDLAKASWEDIKDKDAVVQILKEHGWPEPLIARFGEVVMFAPVILEHRIKIAEKQTKLVFERLKRQYHVKEFSVDPDFYRVVADSFFAHSRGARAIRDFAETALADLFTQSVIELYENLPHLKDLVVRFSVKDSYDGVWNYEGDYPPYREVKLRMQVESQGQVFDFESDVSMDAPIKRLVNRRELASVAYHEAGHAVANDFRVTGQILAHVTIQGRGDYGGYARYESVDGMMLPTRKTIVERLARALAGGEAERRYEEQKGASEATHSSGRSMDLQQARQLAQQAIESLGLSAKNLGLPVVNGKVNIKSKEAQAAIKELLEEAEVRTEQILKEKWHLVEEFAQALLQKTYLDRADIDAIVPDQRGVLSRNDLRRRHVKKPGGSVASVKGSSCEQGFGT